MRTGTASETDLLQVPWLLNGIVTRGQLFSTVHVELQNCDSAVLPACESIDVRDNTERSKLVEQPAPSILPTIASSTSSEDVRES